VEKLESKESSAIEDSKRILRRPPVRGNSGAWRLHKGQLGRIQIFKGRVRLPFPGSNTYLLEV